MRVTLVATVLNEIGSLPEWITGLNQQSRLPDECLIVDGGSSDGTLEYLQAASFAFPCRVLAAPGATISTGRNIAIERASCDVIAVTDAGTCADPQWLERLTAPFESRPDVDIVAGFFEASGQTLWTETLGAATLPDANEINCDEFLASSRSVAFRRRWFDAGFRYPAWLDYCEDVVFDLQLRRAGAKQVMARDAIVRFAPRPGTLSYARQYFRYARGDGKAGLFAKRHAIRYLTYLLTMVVFIRQRPPEIVLAMCCAAVYVQRPIQRFRHRASRQQAGRRSRLLIAAITIAIQRGIGDCAKMAGYPVGLWWRYRTDKTVRFWKTGWSVRLPDGRVSRTSTRP